MHVMSSRHITIRNDGWINSVKPKSKRAAIMRMIFSLAHQHGYDVRVEGERWTIHDG